MGSISRARGHTKVCLQPFQFPIVLTHLAFCYGRPSQWSKSSIIYTAHEYEARVVGRHFPSSRQFLLPNPPFPYAMESYEPPTVLSICPTDDLLFAYFPGKGQDGFGCVWHKEAQVDSWSVKDTWTYAVSGGVVTAAWSCPHREVSENASEVVYRYSTSLQWTVSEAGSSTRLPAIGPLAPPGNPLLILVTASHMLHVFAILPQGKAQQHSRVSLLQSDSYNMQSPVEPDSIGKIGGDKICMKAAIGLSYQGTYLSFTQLRISSSIQSRQFWLQCAPRFYLHRALLKHIKIRWISGFRWTSASLNRKRVHLEPNGNYGGRNKSSHYAKFA